MFFSMLIYCTIIMGLILSGIGMVIVRPVAQLFASMEENMTAAEQAELVEYCVVYARIILAALPAFMLQNAFQGLPKWKLKNFPKAQT